MILIMVKNIPFVESGVLKSKVFIIYGGYSITVSMLDCGSEGGSSILLSHPKLKYYEKGIG